MLIKIETQELKDQVHKDLTRILSDVFLVGAPEKLMLTDIHARVLYYIENLAPEDFTKLFVLKGTVINGSMIEIKFDPTDEFYIRIIKDFYESRP